MRRVRLVLLLATVAMSCTASSVIEKNRIANRSSSVSAMYVLGDSSVDCGNNTLFYPILHHNLSLIPCNASDSSLIPHLLAEKIGLPQIQSFYSQNGSIEGLLHGVNFGSAQATIMNPYSTSYQSLNEQLRQLFETFQLLQLQLSEENARHFFNSSLFYLSFGKDDYINLFLHNSSSIMLNYSSKQFAHILVNQMKRVIRNLYDANARKIITMGILPLGCTPRVVYEWFNSTGGDDEHHQIDSMGCANAINELVLEYNKMLNEEIVKLNVELADAQLVFCDVYQGIIRIITDPRKYGFKDVKSACCGLGSYGASIGCLSADMACEQASHHVWWDLYNPTQAVNSLLSDSAWSAKPFSICHPFTLHDLVYTK